MAVVRVKSKGMASSSVITNDNYVMEWDVQCAILIMIINFNYNKSLGDV